MALLDAYALVAFLNGESAEHAVRDLLEERSSRIAATNLAETYDRSIRTRGIAKSELDDVLDRLIGQGFLVVVPLDDRLARRAGELRASHYSRGTRDVSHADCVAAATAEALQETIATSDVALAEMARAIGVQVMEL